MQKTYDNKGALFTNRKKTKPNQPDHTGKLKVKGVEMRLAAWEKEDKNGNKYLSIAAEEANHVNEPQGETNGF